MRTTIRTVFCTAAALLVVGCAGLPAAQMALPTPLRAQTPEKLEGLGAGREGSFTLAGSGGKYKRSADKWSLFDAVVHDRLAAGYTFAPGSSAAVDARCRAQRTEASVGIVAGAVQPYTLHCDFSGAFVGALTLSADSRRSGEAERSGQLRAGDLTLRVQSVNRIEGSSLPLQSPIGYVFLHDGKPVGAVEINGLTPRLWRPPASSGLRDAVTQAALALALLWEPAEA